MVSEEERAALNNERNCGMLNAPGATLTEPERLVCRKEGVGSKNLLALGLCHSLFNLIFY